MRCANPFIKAPSILSDADDTAKALLTLHLSGKAAKTHQMIDHFRTKNGHFRTYPGETDASFSANCNVLISLTRMPNVDDFGSSISSTATFLSETWWSGSSRDKWVGSKLLETLRQETDYQQNNSLQYSMMFLAEALTQLLVVWDQGLLKTLPEALIRDRIPVMLPQILNRTLLAQTEGGPERCPEITAYGILTLFPSRGTCLFKKPRSLASDLASNL